MHRHLIGRRAAREQKEAGEVTREQKKKYNETKPQQIMAKPDTNDEV
jgi:hypothetical protein